MKKPISADLLERYLNGECTSEEEETVKEWYDSFENEYDHVSALSSSEEKNIEGNLYKRITANINTNHKTSYSRNTILKLVYTAASIAAVLLIAISIFMSQRQNVKINNDQIVAIENINITNTSKVIYKALLPDSSTIWLSPGSKISYQKEFDQASRLISMSGECFFEVRKDSMRPFIIRSNSIITKVWGTSFRISDANEYSDAEVSVVTGKVSVKIRDNNEAIHLPLEKDEVMLYPDQKVTLLRKQRLLKTQTENKHSSVYIWRRVNLAFESLPLKSIVPVLNANYHSRIKIDNQELNNYMLTADFDGFNLPEVLDALKKSLNINYEIKGDSIVLK